jgi:transposase
MDSTNDKKEYRRIQAILQKADGRTYEYIAQEHRVHLRTAKKWVNEYVKKGVEGLMIKKHYGGPKPRITDNEKEIILSVLFNDPQIFGYLRNTWSLRSLARCLMDHLGIPIDFKHLQRILKGMGVRCKMPKLELEHGPDYEEGKERMKNYKQVASAFKKRSDTGI